MPTMQKTTKQAVSAALTRLRPPYPALSAVEFLLPLFQKHG
jgi:hypothetical protein